MVTEIMSENEEICPLVSVVCTTYNHEKYIRQCLDGFVMQKTTFPIEIIVHDDASTDDTVRIVREYEEKHPNLFNNIYRTENWYSQGKNIWGYLFAQKARGKYIALCEGDDYWIDPYKLQKQVDFLEGHPEYYVVGMRSLCYLQDGNIYRIYLDSFHVRSVFQPKHYIKQILMHTSTLCIRKDCIKMGQYNHPILQGDIDIVLHSSRQGMLKLKVLKTLGSIYRIHSNGITKSQSHQNRRLSYNSLCKILDSYDSFSSYRDHWMVECKKIKDYIILFELHPINFKRFVQITFSYGGLCIIILMNVLHNRMHRYLWTLYPSKQIKEMTR